MDRRAQLDAAREGDRRALARLISAVENRAADLADLSAALTPHLGHAHVVGLTGAPGVGKSTSTAALVRHWREAGMTVAVIAVDPSSPFTGGALLGDRIRLTDHTTDQGVFIRSMASRGHLGGLAAATPAAVRVLDGAGFDLVVIETVGVGQSEVEIVRCADSVAILLAPGMGDRIQAAKAGLLEVGDVFVVNKADRPGAQQTQREIRAMVSMKGVPRDRWRPPVIPTVATEGDGTDRVAAALADHREAARGSGELQRRRLARIRAEIESLVVERWDARLAARAPELDALAARVLAGHGDPYEAAARLLDQGPGDAG